MDSVDTGFTLFAQRPTEASVRKHGPSKRRVRLDGVIGRKRQRRSEHKDGQSDQTNVEKCGDGGPDLRAAQSLEHNRDTGKRLELQEDEHKTDTQASEGIDSNRLRFSDLALSRPILQALSKAGYTHATPIQERTIPVVATGRDVLGAARTGSGKTIAFLAPILERMQHRPMRKEKILRVLVLAPTRELARQCYEVCLKLAPSDISFSLVTGGMDLKGQRARLSSKKGGTDIVIATPGRLVDHLETTSGFHLQSLEVLVIDEADRMLEEGFEHELTKIIDACPRKRQTLLFSATMTSNIADLVKLSLTHPVQVYVDAPTSLPPELKQEFIRVRPTYVTSKAAFLIALCSHVSKERTIVFMNRKATVHRMGILFALFGLRSEALHGNLRQPERDYALERFRSAEVDFLLATDVAARGLDIQGVKGVINYDCPKDEKVYVHRVGRTARAGREGIAITLVTDPERKVIKPIMALHKAGSANQRATSKDRILPPEIVSRYINELRERWKEVDEVMDELNHPKADEVEEAGPKDEGDKASGGDAEAITVGENAQEDEREGAEDIEECDGDRPIPRVHLDKKPRSVRDIMEHNLEVQRKQRVLWRIQAEDRRKASWKANEGTRRQMAREARSLKRERKTFRPTMAEPRSGKGDWRIGGDARLGQKGSGGKVDGPSKLLKRGRRAGFDREFT